VFRRRREANEDAEREDRLDDGSQVTAPTAAAAARPRGPWDAEDAPDDGVERVDLGSLQLPIPPGAELRVDVQDEQVIAATLVDGHSSMQVHAFAAPRSSGIWDDVRSEIATSLRSSGGAAEEASGPFGPELHARVPGEGGVTQPARFVGVDGPRWFVRGLVTGPAATDPNQARRLDEAFRGVVIVRGGDAMAPRDLLPLRLPKEAMPRPVPGAEAEPAKPTLDMLERGPEITETR
jgi:hypothetical protein